MGVSQNPLLIVNLEGIVSSTDLTQLIKGSEMLLSLRWTARLYRELQNVSARLPSGCVQFPPATNSCSRKLWNCQAERVFARA